MVDRGHDAPRAAIRHAHVAARTARRPRRRIASTPSARCAPSASSSPPASGPRARRSCAASRSSSRRRLPDARFEDVPLTPACATSSASCPGTEPAIVLGAHYDTEYHPKGFVGANDAAAAVGAVDRDRARPPARPPARRRARDRLRALRRRGGAVPHQRLLRRRAARVQGLRQRATRRDQGHAAARLHGQQELRLPREGTSNPQLWSRVRAAAAHVGVASVFPPTVEAPIIDDLSPFLRAGIPAVDFIDWSYPVKDTIGSYDQLSEASIDAVGETVVELLRGWR